MRTTSRVTAKGRESARIESDDMRLAISIEYNEIMFGPLTECQPGPRQRPTADDAVRHLHPGIRIVIIVHNACPLSPAAWCVAAMPCTIELSDIPTTPATPSPSYLTGTVLPWRQPGSGAQDSRLYWPQICLTLIASTRFMARHCFSIDKKLTR